MFNPVTRIHQDKKVNSWLRLLNYTSANKFWGPANIDPNASSFLSKGLVLKSLKYLPIWYGPGVSKIESIKKDPSDSGSVWDHFGRWHISPQKKKLHWHHQAKHLKRSVFVLHPPRVQQIYSLNIPKYCVNVPFKTSILARVGPFEVISDHIRMRPIQQIHFKWGSMINLAALNNFIFARCHLACFSL